MRSFKLSSPMKIFLVSFIAMTLAMAALGCATYQACYQILADDIGRRAQATALVAANLVEIDPVLINEISSLDILSARNHAAALDFKKKMAPLIKHSGVSYIYVEVKLTSDQVKYFVNPDEEGKYGVTPGTPMEYLYVLTSEDESYYSNKDRYDVGNQLRERVYTERVPMYSFPTHDAKWGYFITGYAPLYHHGYFIGLLGVDIAGEEFHAAVTSVRNIIGFSFGIIVLLGGFFLYRASLFLSKPMLIDGLTKLFNHQYMKARLQEEISRARRYQRPLSILMLDLDFFKRLNDSFGHQAGDQVLQRVAMLIQNSIREGDIACRYGGEEITVILPETSLAEATVVAERIRSAIGSAEYYVGPVASIQIKVTVSIGIAELTDETSPEMLLSKADQALYLAKSKGRNRCDCCA